jgi:hypothetical protein
MFRLLSVVFSASPAAPIKGFYDKLVQDARKPLFIAAAFILRILILTSIEALTEIRDRRCAHDPGLQQETLVPRHNCSLVPHNQVGRLTDQPGARGHFHFPRKML